MKFTKLSQLLLVSALGLLVATLLSGCLIVTLDYVFVADSTGTSPGSTGQIEIYAVDAETGALRPVDQAVPSGGSHPVALAATSDYANLYAANQGNNSIVHFSIAYSGALTKEDEITTSAPPVALAISTVKVQGNAYVNTYLYVISGTGTTPATLTEYALGTGGAIGSAVATETLVLPGYTNDTIVPTAVTVLANNQAVYVTAYDQSAYNPGGTVTSSANPGWIFGYAIGSNGVLTPSLYSPWEAGVKPTSIAADPNNLEVYATDYASNQLIGYGIIDGTRLEFLVDGPFQTGDEPSSVTVDPRGLFIYVANSLQSSVSGYAINLANGTPSAIFGTVTATNTTDTDPVDIIVEPSLGRYVYTANYVSDSISGFRLNPNNGSFEHATENTPYPTGVNPTAIVAVPHGNHAIESITP